MDPQLKTGMQIAFGSLTVVLTFIIAIFVLNQIDSNARLDRQIACIDAGGTFDTDSRDCVLDRN